ncbi:double-strand break repair protein AddB [Rhodovulum sulfidophilum]|uniref:Double-strand break repair protein AddB n=1 Tax=Rhodovulum visakhapatnamense TaxID=364297 RepID=A0ABS1RAF1_9RHOB|nr:double-strand break repair protein AddB [Rhodovulum visakhapatnamense]MBL3568244.1 double-strand break repair protein AddB [Rhodovulum visakhapatnamense]MBL3576618.1 double-strand break repair protein AddB [Rhodovulum visakhapatnamense]OLS43196.1 double-strand break repair protein AddB [Rhodovulum sulfidophilum]
MFEGSTPRLYGLPPGADFPRDLLIGLEQRLSGAPPEAWAEVEIWVNTERMRRRLVALFQAGPPRLLPRIRLVAELSRHPILADLPAPVSPLRRRLELAQLVRALLDRAPDLAARSSAFDLADSLAALLDEMQTEGVPPRVLHQLDVGNLSAHWARARQFLTLVEGWLGADLSDRPGTGARQRLAVERLAARWRADPPRHPVIVAGTTGSRGATALFLRTVAGLPQGAAVLPGFDFDMPTAIWEGLDDALAAEDHPQFRFRRILDDMGMAPEAVAPWIGTPAPCPPRNRLVSLALRPAPVTDQWMEDGPRLTGLDRATEGLTLIEAPSPRAEALAIALRLRRAAEDGQSAALVTPDRTLTRQVTAALDRWGIRPDDSAGMPLPLSPPGRFLRQVAALFGRPLTVETLLALLKHPLTASSPGLRADHLRWTRELELHLRRNGPAFPDGRALIGWASDAEDGRKAWADWLSAALDGVDRAGTEPLSAHVVRHRAACETLAAGPGSTDPGGLWLEEAGAQSRAALDLLADEADAGGEMTPGDFSALLDSVLRDGTVRSAVEPHPGVMIWGTLEARVQGADLVILAGLNEGTWPETPPPDPWLNRQMRAEAGLLLPERQIGLAAHDFQQAICAPEVMISRAIRTAEAQTVPARWLNRLTNLMDGLGGTGGPEALAAMRARGQGWLDMAQALDRPAEPLPAARRPSPRPPVDRRPDRLSVTAVERLIRDPYAVYARHILRLKRLDPLVRSADAPLRGTVLHKVMERFLSQPRDPDPDRAQADLMAIADEVLATEAPWPAARALWRARLGRAAESFLRDEAVRQAEAVCIARERSGAARLDNGFTLTAQADRIDRRPDGRLILYDYKTGTPPSLKAMEAFDKQLLLEACIAERGGFEDIPAAPVDHVTYIGLGQPPKTVTNTLDDDLVARTWAELDRLIARYARPEQGYTARNRIQKRSDITDYDLLSRFGEWDETDPPDPEDVG